MLVRYAATHCYATRYLPSSGWCRCHIDSFQIPGGRWSVTIDEPSSLTAILAAALSGLHQKVPVESDELVDCAEWLDLSSIDASLSPW
jgi:hypothetical protein